MGWLWDIAYFLIWESSKGQVSHGVSQLYGGVSESWSALKPTRLIFGTGCGCTPISSLRIKAVQWEQETKLISWLSRLIHLDRPTSWSERLSYHVFAYWIRPLSHHTRCLPKRTVSCRILGLLILPRKGASVTSSHLNIFYVGFGCDWW